METNLNLILKLSPDKNLSKCTIVKRVFVIIVDLIIYVGTQSRKTKAFAYLLKGFMPSTQSSGVKDLQSIDVSTILNYRM